MRMKHKNRKNQYAPDRVEFGYSFQIAEGMWERIGVDVALKPGETIESKSEELSERLKNIHRKLNPQLYKKGNEAIVGSFGTNGNVEKVIDRFKERLEGLIEDCTTMEELETYKDDVTDDIFPAYAKKMDELINKKKLADA